MEKFFNFTENALNSYLGEIVLLLQSWQKGDASAENKLQRRLDQYCDGMLYKVICEMLSAGFEPAFLAIPRLVDSRAEIDEDDNLRGDYTNVYFPLKILLSFTENIEEIREFLSYFPLHTFEARYFTAYVDLESKILRRSNNPKVIKVNEMTQYINENVKNLDTEELRKLVGQLAEFCKQC